MNLSQLTDYLKSSDNFMKNVTHWREIPPREARYASFPDDMDMRIADMLRARGIHRIYTHQRDAIDAVSRGEDITVVTPTASGKTLCYNLPVLQEVLKHPESRALYLFPTKALSSDQVAELYEMIQALNAPIKAFTYDGDTPGTARSSVRKAGQVVVTNPDMLHAGILPHHTKWVKLFENLKFIVIDEIHAYRGVFGGNLANVLRRLLRICAFYGSRPQFICCSATIQNPKELATRVTGREMTLVDNNGAPAGARHVVFYNPPVVNEQLGIRKGVVTEVRKITTALVRNGIQTIVFARSRLQVEVLLTYLKTLVKDQLGGSRDVRGYRGGYLPTLRREIERGLRNGEITCVVSTNALELGIDIGQLDACVLCGYPGTIASTWQQAGRAGRRQSSSLTILVASSSPLDQYIIAHPEYFFEQSPENALINPDNLYVMLNHFKCAAYELPFVDDELFGDVASSQELLEYLCEEDILRHVGGRYHWMAEEFPASEISLRSAADENFLIVDITTSKHEVIGEMDRFTVPMLLHEKAIYMHEGQQYQVEKLDFDEKKAYIRKVDVGYYTDANLSTTLKVLDVLQSDEDIPFARYCGEVMVSCMVTLFKKIKFDTHENLGFGHVDLPELEMHTTAYWATLPDEVCKGYHKDDLQGAMVGVAHLLKRIAPLYLMCAAMDVACVYHVKDPFTKQPTLYLYDTCPGGIGLAEKLYALHTTLFARAYEHVSACPCESGCPSCLGAAMEIGGLGKRIAMEVLQKLGMQEVM